MATTAPPIRRWIVRTTIGSFSLAALMGIAALLGGDFGETQGRILLTTVLVGVVSIAVLCYLAATGGRWQLVAVAGGVVVVLPTVTGLIMIWGNPQGVDDWIIKTFGVGAIVAATLAQASLLLALAGTARGLVARLLPGTLVMAAGLAVMTSALVLRFEPQGDGYYRVLGVVAILDVLGTVVAAALTKFGTGGQPSDGSPDPGHAALPARLQERVTAYARARGADPDAVVASAVEQFLDAAERDPARPTSS